MDIKTMLAEETEGLMRTCWPEAAELPEAETLRGMLAVPPERAMGDYALPVFTLARALRMAPPKIAQVLASAWQNGDLARAEAVNGYVNFFLNRVNFAALTLKSVLEAGDRYGASEQGRGKTVCLDYSSINIAKRFHIGHLSTTMLGNSLKRIYEHLGYTTVGINHLGDWGTQFGKMLCAYAHWGDEQRLAQYGVDELTSLYQRFHQEAREGEPDENTALVEEGRSWFRRMEEGDREALDLFDRFKELTLRDAARVYDLLGVRFDSYAGESFYNDKTDRVVEELKAKNLLTVSQGASVVDLSAFDMPPCIILKKDGATVYATRDLAAALFRHETYHFDKCLYVVAYQQDLHFRQVFKVLELMGCEWARDMVHVSFGMISYEGGAMSTRSGHVVLLDDLLEQAQQKALAIINEKSPDLPDKETVARQVGIGAVVYADLSSSRIKDIDFHWDRALNFDGETGPYVQYTHARCCTLLKKAADLVLPQPDWNGLTDDEAQHLLRLLGRFPDEIREAAQKYEPFMITRAVTEIAKAFNKFYYEHRILDDEPGVAAARVALTRAVRSVIRTGLYLIGIEAPERM